MVCSGFMPGMLPCRCFYSLILISLVDIYDFILLNGWKLAIVAVVVIVCVVIEEIRKRLFNKLESRMITKIDSLLNLSF